jgi:hypothetical protein
MELIEIIKSTLSIFLITGIVFIATSYIVFRIKDRSRIKPYLRVNEQKPLGSILHDRIVLAKIPIQNKFTMINEKVVAYNLNKSEYKKENPRYRVIANDDKKNMYDFYPSLDAKTPKLNLVTR